MAAPVIVVAPPAFANVIADWNENAVTFVTPRMAPGAGQRVVAIMQVAMFDAVNSIERRYLCPDGDHSVFGLGKCDSVRARETIAIPTGSADRLSSGGDKCSLTQKSRVSHIGRDASDSVILLRKEALSAS
jgi:hypothetical protein